MTERAPPPSGEHVVILTTSYPRAPGDFAGHFVAEEAQELSKSGARVTVLAAGAKAEPLHLSEPHGLSQPPSLSASSGVDVRFLGGACLFDHPGALVRLSESKWRARGLLTPSLHLAWLRLTSSLGPIDRLDAHWLMPCGFPWGLLLGQTETRRSVILHGSDVRLYETLPILQRRLILDRLLKAQASLRFVSASLKMELREAAPTSRLKAFVDTGEIRAASLSREPVLEKPEARATLGISSTERVAVIASRLISEKRLDTALGAALLVPDLSIYVLGDGPLRTELQHRFPSVHFLGPVAHDRTLLFIRAADLILTASRREGAPTLVREALRLGTPVISTPSGDLGKWRDQRDKMEWRDQVEGLWLVD